MGISELLCVLAITNAVLGYPYDLQPPSSYETVSINVSTPANNSPLNENLAFYTMSGYNGPTDQLTHSFIPVSCGANISVHHTDPGVFTDGGTPSAPVLLLNHGYPQSSYIWRAVTPSICERVPCIVPDRPGYGLSTVCPNGTDERTNAGAILETAAALYGHNVTVILGGHDRGARSMHRAAVDIGQGGFPFVNALGLFIADIVPIVEEYASFAYPNYSTGYFHWSFLPRVRSAALPIDFSTDVIMAYGGGNWIDYILAAGSGTNATATALFKANDAWATYHTFFDQLAVTNASVYDYAAGATVDYTEQAADQAAGRKIKMPTHVLYSYYNLVQESGFDVRAVWENYTESSAKLTMGAVCCGQGHFIIELAPQQTVDQLNEFLDSLGVSSARVAEKCFW